MAPYDRPKETLAVVNHFMFVDTPAETSEDKDAKDKEKQDKTLVIPQLLVPLTAETREKNKEKIKTTDAAAQTSASNHSLKLALLGLFVLVTAGIAWQRRRDIISRVWRKSGPGW